MNKLVPIALTALLALSACSDETETDAADPAVSTTSEPAPAPSTTERETGEAMEAIGEAGRQTGEAARSALEDLSEAAGPAIDQAREAGSKALDDAREGLNNATRSAACRTARAAEDADGIAANC
ncbi:hypothetical protein [Aurantimonas manganoxydans]|uniref:Uncharacterized protein n=1 Tax=Aurantimonas manganoxydans TaxID=651183 RepID=A0A0P0Z4K4_9HYPH|nr:hypothetical protein [Aurantimonas manganoxydans]BAT29037.1 hypothetical protein [Aurantimonas manganoxydans SI85-9A1]